MNDFKEFMLSEVNGIFHSILKNKSDGGDDQSSDLSNAVNEITNILLEEGYIQHKIMDVYKRYSVSDTDVAILRLNKYIEKLYIENESKIKEERENSIKIPEHHMNQWLAELIEEDLYTGIAPFENTLQNVRKIHDIAINYDPLFDAINYELQGMYKYIKDNRLINPITFEDKVESDDANNNEDISTSFSNIENVANNIEYVESPFAHIDIQ